MEKIAKISSNKEEKENNKNVSNESNNILIEDKGKIKKKMKEFLKNSKKRKRNKSFSSSSDSFDSSNSSSISSSSRSRSSKNKNRHHSRKTKNKKKHKKKKGKHTKKSKKDKKSPKKSKWTTVNTSGSPVITKHCIAEGETNDIIFQREQFRFNKEEINKQIFKEESNLKSSSGKEINIVNGITVKFTEPLDSAIPNESWRLYPFKDNECQDPLQINRQSSYLVGKDKRIAHILVNHPSCSRQHSVLQYREDKSTDENGKIVIVVKPYIMDLESTNGTFINKSKIESSKYYEIKNYDIINFGFSTRDYIITKVNIK